MLLKKVLILIAIISLLPTSGALIHVVSPVDEKLSDSGTLLLGPISAGETLEIIAKKKSQKEFQWAEIKTHSLQFTALQPQIESSDETLITKFTLPSDLQPGIYRINVTLSNPMIPKEESFDILLDVQGRLWDVSLKDVTTEATANSELEYTLFFVNDSIAEHAVAINSNLPNFWMQPVQLTLPAQKTKEVTVSLTPKTQGRKMIVFTVNSGLNNSSKQTHFVLNVIPTPTSKYAAAQYGLPFFNISLLPFYIINSFLSLLSGSI